jgi:ribonuclease P protein subunit POP4
MQDAKDVARHELIGLEAEVIGSKNKSDIGLKGKIIDETKSTISLQAKKRKVLFKNNITLIIRFKGKAVKIEGNLLSGKPKERTKNG